MKRNMKKCRLFAIVILLLCLLSAASAASAMSILNEGADCAGETLIIDLLAQDATLQLGALLPGDAEPGVTWRSSDKSIATVSEDGLVTGVKPGTVTITAASAGNAKVKAVCKVRVTNLAKEIWITGSDTAVGGKTIALQVEVLPEETSDKALSWTSSDPEIAAVSSASGVVLAYKTEDAKTATITAAAKDGSGITADWIVTVRPPVQQASLMYENADCTSGAIVIDLASGQAGAQLSAVISPADADQAVTWRSSNQSVATVSQDGLVTGLKEGAAVITAISASDIMIKAVCNVNVTYLAKEIIIDGNNTVTGGRETTLTAEVLPMETVNKAVTWESSDPAIAAVSADGVVMAQETDVLQMVTMTAAATDGSGVTAEWMMVVDPAVKKVALLYEGADRTLDTLQIDLTSGPDTLRLGAAVYPAAADQSVIWQSSDESVATVSQDGTVTGLAKGTVTISASSVNGEKADGSVIKAFCNVKVVNLVSKLTIIGPDTLTAGETATYDVEILPKEAGGAVHYWNLSIMKPAEDNPDELVSKGQCPENIATVDELGTVSVNEGITEVYMLGLMTQAQDGSDVYTGILLTVVPK